MKKLTISTRAVQTPPLPGVWRLGFAGVLVGWWVGVCLFVWCMGMVAVMDLHLGRYEGGGRRERVGVGLISFASHIGEAEREVFRREWPGRFEPAAVVPVLTVSAPRSFLDRPLGPGRVG